MNYTITIAQTDLIHAMNVLATRPYAEVAALISSLIQQRDAQDEQSALSVESLSGQCGK